MSTFLRMQDQQLAGQRVLIREDLNVPLSAGQVTSDARIRAALPTIKASRDSGARTLLLSHLGRPSEGTMDPQYSLSPVASRLSALLGQPVRLASDWLAGVDIAEGEVVLGENVRFMKGEKANDEALARRMAALCDVFVMDAFATAHRAHASTHGIARFAPIACAGPLLCAELDALAAALDKPRRPLVAIVGGSKVSTKLGVLESLSRLVDELILGGGIANTFIAGANHPVGQSLYEADLVNTAQELMKLSARGGANIPMPTDVVVASDFSATAKATVRQLDEVAENELILDIGPETAATYADIVQRAGTVVWNGPLGVFEFDQFGDGTRVLAEAIASSPAFSIAGGGDTLAAMDKYDVYDKIGYVSTGGGAFLEFLEGKTLPAVAILKQRAL